MPYPFTWIADICGAYGDATSTFSVFAGKTIASPHQLKIPIAELQSKLDARLTRYRIFVAA